MEAGFPHLLFKAFEQAQRLDHGWVGSEHFLLALLATPSVATEVLAELGLTFDGLSEFLRTLEYESEQPRYDPEIGLSGPSAAGYQLMGWAQGLATAWGHAEPAPEHWLVAMVFDPNGIPELLHAFGISQENVLRALRERNVRVPDVDPPPYRPWRGLLEVEVSEEQLDAVLALLAERHPPGSEWRWGFNWIDDELRRARVDAEEGIDLGAIIEEAQA